jgi:rhodanese-related sulfurtransferase
MLHQIVSFVMKHWVLVIAFIAVAVVIVIEEIRSQSAGGKRVTSMMATQLINRQDAIVIDIREPNVFRDGHIVNARNFPVLDLERQIEKLKAYTNRCVILVDENGFKVQAVALKLKSAGMTDVVVLKGGMESWLADSLPVVK